MADYRPLLEMVDTIYLANQPLKIIGDFSQKLSEDDFLKLMQLYADRYGYLTAEPFSITRSILGTKDDEIASNGKWLIDIRPGDIYDLKTTSVVKGVKLNGADVLTDNVKIHFTYDSSAIIYNEKNKYINYLAMINQLPFMLNINTDLQINTGPFILLINLQGKHFIFYQLTPPRKFFVYAWFNNKLNLEYQLTLSSHELINQLQYTLYLRLEKWSEGLIPQMDKLAHLFIGNNPTTIDKLTISPDDEFIILAYSVTGGYYYMLVKNGDISLIQKWQALSQVKNIEWYEDNNFVITFDLKNVIYRIRDLNKPIEINKQLNEHHIFLSTRNKPELKFKMIDPTPNLALNIKRLSEFSYVISLIQNITNYPLINITTVDNKPFFQANDKTLILLNLAKGISKGVNNDLNGGKIIQTLNGWMQILPNKMIVFNSRSGAMKNIGFSEVSLYVDRGDYKLKEIYTPRPNGLHARV